MTDARTIDVVVEIPRGSRNKYEYDHEQHCAIVARYFDLAGGWDEPVAQLRTPPTEPGDPLYAVWARR